ncbi:MAG: hypothetical protein R2705_00885 [Ilumatobacteraceae bacterium]
MRTAEAIEGGDELRTVAETISATGSTLVIRPATWPLKAMAAFMSPPK